MLLEEPVLKVCPLCSGGVSRPYFSLESCLGHLEPLSLIYQDTSTDKLDTRISSEFVLTWGCTST